MNFPILPHSKSAMLDYLLVEPTARLHLLVVPMVGVNGMENFGLLNIRESVCDDFYVIFGIFCFFLNSFHF
jgi:hypothetical protein